MSKIMHNKILVFSILLIISIFILNTNISYAKKISFDLHGGLISTIVGGEENENEDEPADEDEIVKDGAYIISSATNENYVFDIDNSSLDNGGNLQLWSRTEEANQKFYFSYQGDGYYKISSVCSALALDVKDGSKENSANIRQWSDNGTDAQRFKIIKNTDGTYSFKVKVSGKMLDVEGAVFENGRNIQQYKSNNTIAQHFNIEKVDLVNEGITSIKKATNNKVGLDVPSNSSNDGLAIQLYENNNSLAQRFEIHKVDENEIRIRTASSGGWLTEKGKKNGSEVVQIGNSSTPVSKANTWKVEWNDGITLKNKESGLYLDINANSNDNGAKIQVWEKSKTQEAQRFIINKENLINDGWYEISSQLGTTMNLDDSSSGWGTNILMWEKKNQSKQKFKITYKDSGYLITTIYGLALDVENGSKDNSANVRQWEDNGTACQRWLTEVADGGYIRFKNLNSGKYLDVTNASKDNGANVQQYEGNGTNAQLWKLTSATLNEFVGAWGDDYCTDIPYLQTIIDRANRVGSDTDWFIAIDVRKFRLTLVCRENGMWKIDACFYATMGYLGSNGMSHTGLSDLSGNPETNWAVTHKEAYSNGDIWNVSYIDHWLPNGADDCQKIHNHYEIAGQSYSSHGCPRLTDEHAKYLYDSVPIGTRVHIWHDY